MMKSLFSKLEINHISKDFDATFLIIVSILLQLLQQGKKVFIYENESCCNHLSG
jgi:hypothetical protein